ncbi:MAG: YybH family protein [Chloroflexota bacterium]
MPAWIPADVDRLFAEAVSAHDLHGALAIYEEDACFEEGEGVIARGHEEISLALERLIARSPTLDCHEIDVIENGNLAVLRARWTFTAVGANGESHVTHGRSIEVVRRQPDGSWKFAIDLPSGASADAE